MRSKFLFLFLLCFLSTETSAAPPVSAAARTEMAKTLSRIVGREVAGAVVKITGVDASKKRVRVYASIGLSYYPFREENTAAMLDSVRRLLPKQFASASLELYSDEREVHDLIPMAFRSAAMRKRMTPFTNRSKRPLLTRLDVPATPTLGLADRHIALWQSHGRYFDQEKNRWCWQRARLWETCEDLYTQSYVLPYLVPMLENAGACVLLPRERDVQKYEVLADNDAPGQYCELDGAEPWQQGGVGFAHRKQVYLSGENPFRDGTTRRVRTTTDGAESQAVWTAVIPEAGEYAVYVSYASSSDSADDASYTVSHTGGQSRFAVNQTMGGGTWIYLGHFPFAAGEQQIVTLSNRSAKTGRTVSADAVKIGGGVGNIARAVGDPLKAGEDYVPETSGYPRFCEGARYWLQWAGFGERVYTPKQGQDDYKDDYMSRANWVNALMGGSERLADSTGLHIPVDMALAFHSDSGVRSGDQIVGTLGIYYTRDNKGRFAGGADRYRSRDLTDLVQTQLVDDIRRTWEPAWTRRSLWNRSYYEARVPCAPTMLLELLSHHNFADMRYGNDPRFKFTVSRAVYKGILRFISSQYNTPYVVQPLPVEQLALEFSGDDAVTLSWSPVLDSLEETAAPTAYAVYTRRGDGGFDNGRRVEEPKFTASQTPGVIYSYKVTALNEGGESFPSEILSACRVPEEKGVVLIVNGFNRVSAPVSSGCDSLAGFYHDRDGGVADVRDISFTGRQHVFDRSMAHCDNYSIALGACYDDFATDVLGGNTFDYPSLHGRAAVAAGYSFCSASLKAVEQDDVRLGDYPAVDVILGKQRSTVVARGVSGVEFRTFSPDLQDLLRRYAAAGGAVFASGSYIASDLWTGPLATDADRTFASEVLHMDYDSGAEAQKGRVRVVSPRAGFAPGEYRFYDYPGADHYLVEASDALLPAQGAFTVMRYLENDRAAAVASASGSRTFVMGFPFESLTTEAQRNRLMGEILRFLIPQK